LRLLADGNFKVCLFGPSEVTISFPAIVIIEPDHIVSITSSSSPCGV